MQLQRSGHAPYDQTVEHGANLIFVLLSIFTNVADMILRPFYGSQYISPIAQFLSVLVMLILPLIKSAFDSVPPIFIAAHIQQPQAFFTLWSLTKLFLLLSVIHGFRTAWLRFDLSREEHSRYEGPALLPIRILPYGQSFWVCRILIEPAVVLLIAVFMRRLMIFDAALSNFLIFVSLCMVLKQYLTWFGSWRFQRDVLDAKYAGPILAALLDDKANPKDCEKLHVVTIPKNTPPDIRRAAVEHMVRVVSLSNYPITQGESHATDK